MNEDRQARRRFAVELGAGVAASAVGLLLPPASREAAAAGQEEASSANSGLVEEIRGFIAAYDAAFRSFDGARVAPFYHAPCITVRGAGWSAE